MDAARKDAPPPTWWSLHTLHRCFEIAGIAAFAILSIGLTFDIITTIQEQTPALPGWLIAGAIFAAWLFADFSSGLVHWGADNWGSEHWPIFGTGFIEPFREHHVDELAITRHGFIELNGNNCIVSLMLFWFASIATGSAEWVLFVQVFWLAAAWWVFGTNQFHAWAHVEKIPKPIQWLQATGIILRPKHHDVHHVPPHERNYCITSGAMNPVLGALRFFEIIEWCMTKVTGVEPRHKIELPPDAKSSL